MDQNGGSDSRFLANLTHWPERSSEEVDGTKLPRKERRRRGKKTKEKKKREI